VRRPDTGPFRTWSCHVDRHVMCIAHCAGLSMAVQCSVHVVELPPLSADVGREMVQAQCPAMERRQAAQIALIFNNNPLKLAIVAAALKEGRMTTEQALLGPALDGTEGDRVIDQVGTGCATCARALLLRYFRKKNNKPLPHGSGRRRVLRKRCCAQP
jgi:hypothetical protein